MIETTPSPLDFSPIHDRMQWYVDQNLIPCCHTLVLRGTDVLDVHSTGFLDRESGRPIQQDSIFRMHSSTKLVTSVAAMMLWQEGRFQLSDPLEAYLPEFANPQVLVPGAKSIEDTEPVHDSIRIHQILSHSGGLSYGFLEPDTVIDRAYAGIGLAGTTPEPGLTLASLCERVATLPLASQPGARFRYSVSTDVTARLIEVISGQRFDEFLRERIFEPLGMVDTDFYVPTEKLDRLAVMYTSTDPMDIMAPAPHPVPEAPADTRPSLLSGGGGLQSTLVDFLAFTQMLMNEGEWKGERLLEPATLVRMRTNQLDPGKNVDFTIWTIPDTVFGLGFALKQAPATGEPESAIDEYHWGGMAGTHFWMAPRAGIAGICMTQRMPGFWHPFSHDFKRLAYEIAG